VKTLIGTVTIITVEDENYIEDVYRDLTELRREFIHPHGVLSEISKQKQKDLVDEGYHIQSVCIDPTELIW